jgi:hypothetical protein
MKASGKLTAVALLVSTQGHELQRDVDWGSGLQVKLCPGIVRSVFVMDSVLRSALLDNYFLFP